MKGILKGIVVGFRIFFLMAALFALVRPARPATFVTATVVVTNTPTVNGNALTVNAATRTFTNVTTANPAIYVLTSSAIGGSATNLYAQIAKYPFSGTMQVSRSGTNGIILRGGADEAMAVSITANWATLTLVTNTSTETFGVRVPAESTSASTNVFSLLVTAIGNQSTNPFSATSAALVNYSSLTGMQTVSGPKTFSGATIISNSAARFVNGVISNATLTNVTINASAGSFTNLQMYGPLYMTNTLPAIVFYEVGAGADEKWTSLTSYGGQVKLSFVKDDGTSSTDAIIVGRTGYGVGSIILNGKVFGTTFETGTFTNITVTNSIAGFTSGTISGVTLTNDTFYGTLGLLSGGYLNGVGATNLTTTNATFTAANIFTGSVAFTRANSTALANGDNAAVNLGVKRIVKLKAGPTGVFAICGIANGTDGANYVIYNATGQNMTIKNDSGGDPTPANRIYTNTGADLTITGNGAVEVWYDTEDSRWVVLNAQL